ncbi:MAG: undecaprenyl-diphosphate phosphatase [Deltaproteobacteria bacterium]|nr:undecaprenyl-diphosphate phosphatase [Deltaproteobacteria bacterium]
MSMLHALLLGLIQGLTEFLPVSSSGHLAIAQHYLPGFRQPGVLFDVLLHLATLLAVVLYFRADIAKLALAPFRTGTEAILYRRLLGLLILGSVPTAIIGLTFKDFFTAMFERVAVVAAMLLVTGVLLFLSERLRRDGRTAEQLTRSDALLVGIAQGCAVMPGISRSGATIATLLIKGVEGETAARFSFLLALPAVSGAALLSLKDVSRVAPAEIPAYLLGMAAAFGIGLLSIHLLLGVIRRRRLAGFAVYCWLVGGFFLLTAL